MSAARVPFQRPEPPAPERILAHYARSVESGWYANRGPCAALLAERVASVPGPGLHGVVTPSGTLALMVALRGVCGEPAGRDLVAVPSFTCPAVAAAIRWSGFTPLFVDVDPLGWHPDPASLSAAVANHGSRVAGIVAAATSGAVPPDATLEAWSALASEAGIPLLIDAAAGLGSEGPTGTRLGAHGDATIFSFHATKPSAAGEGGAIVTADEQLAERFATLAAYGLEGGALNGPLGLNARPSELQAAAGLAMLDELDAQLERRRANAARLRAALAGTPVTFQQDAERSGHQALHVLMPDAAGRERALARAAAANVEVRSLWDPPLHRHSALAAFPRADSLAMTEDLAPRSLSLPMATRLESGEIERIASVVHEACAYEVAA